MQALQTRVAKFCTSYPNLGTIASVEMTVFLGEICAAPVASLAQRSQVQRRILTFYSFLISSFIMFYVVFEIYDLITCWPDLDALTQNISITFAHIAGLIKWLNIFFKASEIRHVKEKLQQLTQQYVRTKDQHDAFQKNEFENKLILTILALGAFLMDTTSFVLFISNPENMLGKFPFCVRFPAWMSINIQILFTTILCWFFAMQIITNDFINIVLMNQIRGQLNILNLAFNDLTVLDATKLALSKTEHLKANERLNEILEHHTEILSLHEQVESIFNPQILCQFFMSLVVFAMNGFRVTVGGSEGSALIYIYCGCGFSELFMFCWCGNEVLEKSQTVATKGFACSWYIFDRKFRSSLLIFLAEAQKPLFFTAGGYMILSLPAFSGILSKSYSYIAVINEMYGNEGT